MKSKNPEIHSKTYYNQTVKIKEKILKASRGRDSSYAENSP